MSMPCKSLKTNQLVFLRKKTKFKQAQKNKLSNWQIFFNQKNKIELQNVELKNCAMNNVEQLETIAILNDKIGKLLRVDQFKGMINKEKYQQMQEIAFLSLNDFQSLQSRQESIMETIISQKSTIKTQQNQLKQFQSQINPDKLIEEKKIVQRSVKHLAQAELAFQIEKISEQIPQMENFEEAIPDNDNIQNYQVKLQIQFSKPSFFQVIDDPSFKDFVIFLYKKYEEEQINMAFLCTVRAIMDAKYDEFLLYDDPRQWTRFPEFVFSWLNNYEYNKIKLQCQSISDFDDTNIMKFFLFLEKNKDKLWEVYTFWELLNDKVHSDTVLFHLSLRHQLLGVKMTSLQSSHFNIIMFVNLTQVKTISDVVFGHLDQTHQSSLLDMISSQAKKKNSVKIVDLAFVLQIFTSFYKKECQIRYEFIQQIFQDIPQAVKKNNKKCILFKLGINNFKLFQYILETNFPETLYLDQMQVFRDCYGIGKGFVSADIFISVANEYHFFTKLLRRRFIEKNPIKYNPNADKSKNLMILNIMNHKKTDKQIAQSQESEEKDPPKVLEQKDKYQQVYNDLVKKINLLSSFVETIGIETISTRLNQLKSIITDQSKLNINQFQQIGMQGYNLYAQYLQMQEKVRNMLAFQQGLTMPSLNHLDFVIKDEKSTALLQEDLSDLIYQTQFTRKQQKISGMFIANRMKKAKCLIFLNQFKSQVSNKVKRIT